MEWLALVGIVGVVISLAIWTIKGVFNTQSKRRQEEQQAWYDSISENQHIDAGLDDERVQHVQDKFND